MATYIKPNAIKDASIEGIKIKDGTISSSKINETVASKNYVDTELGRCAKLDEENYFTKNIVMQPTNAGEPNSLVFKYEEYTGMRIDAGAITIPYIDGYIVFQGDSSATPNVWAHYVQGRIELATEESKEPRLYGIASPIEDLDAANKKYVDDTIKANIATHITYSELKSLRDAGNLVPGTQYRITDYTCTTIQENTKSAGHIFDIIVTADDEGTLNEVARAIKHEGDTYFANNDLNAWKIWYCLDNDTERFAWADTTNGKGVIYRMIDEWNNDVPYDFKNIIYVSKKSFTFLYTGSQYTAVRNNSLDKNIDGTQYYCYSLDREVSFFGGKNCWIKEEKPTINSVLYKSDGSTVNLLGNIISVKAHEYESYTFGLNKNDITILNSNCCNNTIMYYLDGKKRHLNEIIFGEACYNNSFGYNCYNNFFERGCHNNSFESGCRNNSFESGCYNNSFGHDCYNNSFESGCYNNSFGNYCYSNTFGNCCYRNTFGNECYSNTFGIDCQNNTFGNNCHSNTFGNGCDSNTFGNECYSNTFGIGCNSNTFGNECYSNTFGSYFQQNTFGDDCQNNTFGENCVYNTFGGRYDGNIFGDHIQESQFGDGVQYFSITTQQMTTSPTSSYVKNYIRWLIVENGVRYVNAYVTGTTSLSLYCQNVRICLGVQGVSDSNRKTFDITSCINSKLNNVYQPANSQTTSV